MNVSSPLTKGLKLWFIYLILLFLGILYVRSILNTEVIIVKQEIEEDKADEVKPVTVFLNVEGDRNLTFRQRLQNTSSVEELLAKVREDEGFYYELVEHITYIEILVDNKQPPHGYRWRIFVQGEDITDTIRETRLEDDFIYTLKLIRI